MRIFIYLIEAKSEPRTNEPALCLTADTTQREVLSHSLAHVLWLSGKIPPAPLCSGLGLCGRCRVRFLSDAPLCVDAEQQLLTEEELSDGWRLACRHTMATFTDDISLALPLTDLIPPLTQGQTATVEKRQGNEIAGKDIEARAKVTSPPAQSLDANNHGGHCVLAVDLGTTSLCWQLIACDVGGTGDTHDGGAACGQGSANARILAEGQRLNPQMGTGADVISRLALALDTSTATRLATLVHDALRDILQHAPPVREICLAANTAMTSIFLQKDIRSLAAAPYALPTVGHSVEHVDDLPPVYIPPQLAPFVGGDVSAGVLALLERKPAFPFLLADLGTNGEFVLALDEHSAFVTSVPLGPAIEGIGLRFGAMAHGSGVVHTVRLTPHGLTPQSFDGAAPRALCGTGYVSLIHCLLRAGVLQEHGGFYKEGATQNPLSPLGKKLMRHLHDHPDGRRLMLWPSQSDIFLSAYDVEEVLKVKAAFSLAIQELLDAARLSHADVARLYIAGAMGTHISRLDLEGLGFVPSGMGARISPVGNTALAGARILACAQDARARIHAYSQDARARVSVCSQDARARVSACSQDARARIHAWSQGCTLVQLAEDAAFEQKFLTHMTFSYKG